ARLSPDARGSRAPGSTRYKRRVDPRSSQFDGGAVARADRSLRVTELAGGSARQRLPFLITVDDGGVSYHRFIADRLEERGWRGHAFVSTDFIGAPGFLTASEIRELDDRGHIIGSHSASHPSRFSQCHRHH